MSENEYAAAIAEFMRKKGITRCPTACVVPTHGNVNEADRVALRNYDAARDARAAAKARSLPTNARFLRPSEAAISGPRTAAGVFP